MFFSYPINISFSFLAHVHSILLDILRKPKGDENFELVREVSNICGVAVGSFEILIKF